MYSTCNFPPGYLELVECLHVLVHVLGHDPPGLPVPLQDAHTPGHALLSEGASHLIQEMKNSSSLPELLSQRSSNPVASAA